mmetsp:Transcript_14208/g.26395  ORF Transcript_14208/g.26395 Transcript_14208/m.26395 type:complete len:221 (-) Transcript_14208:164-826(-)
MPSHSRRNQEPPLELRLVLAQMPVVILVPVRPPIRFAIQAESSGPIPEVLGMPAQGQDRHIPARVPVGRVHPGRLRRQRRHHALHRHQRNLVGRSAQVPFQTPSSRHKRPRRHDRLALRPREEPTAPGLRAGLGAARVCHSCGSQACMAPVGASGRTLQGHTSSHHLLRRHLPRGPARWLQPHLLLPERQWRPPRWRSWRCGSRSSGGFREMSRGKVPRS